MWTGQSETENVTCPDSEMYNLGNMDTDFAMSDLRYSLLVKHPYK